MISLPSLFIAYSEYHAQNFFKLNLSIAVLMLFMTGVRALFSLWPLAANFVKLGTWCEGIFIALPVWHRASVPLQFVASLAF